MKINFDPKIGSKKRAQKPIKRGQSIYYNKSENQVNQNQVEVKPNLNQDLEEPYEQTFIITDSEVYEDSNSIDFFNESVLRSSEMENNPDYFSTQESPISVICEPDLEFAADGFSIYFPANDEDQFSDMNVNENSVEPGEIELDLTPKKPKGKKIQGCKLKIHNVKVLGFFSHSDFT